jgi:hypothetical protein
MSCLAQYFDGLSSASVTVNLSIESDQLKIEGLGINKIWVLLNPVICVPKSWSIPLAMKLRYVI